MYDCGKQTEKTNIRSCLSHQFPLVDDDAMIRVYPRLGNKVTRIERANVENISCIESGS